MSAGCPSRKLPLWADFSFFIAGFSEVLSETRLEEEFPNSLRLSVLLPLMLTLKPASNPSGSVDSVRKRGVISLKGQFKSALVIGL